MGFFYWLGLFGPVLLVMLVGVFVRFHKEERKAFDVRSVCEDSESDHHTFLCGKKMRLAKAKVHELARIENVSLKKARAIREYLLAYPMAEVFDLDHISGVGPKTIARMREHFY